jgi:hypothetical protein
MPKDSSRPATCSNVRRGMVTCELMCRGCGSLHLCRDVLSSLAITLFTRPRVTRPHVLGFGSVRFDCSRLDSTLSHDRHDGAIDRSGFREIIIIRLKYIWRRERRVFSKNRRLRAPTWRKTSPRGYTCTKLAANHGFSRLVLSLKYSFIFLSAKIASAHGPLRECCEMFAYIFIHLLASRCLPKSKRFVKRFVKPPT